MKVDLRIEQIDSARPLRSFPEGGPAKQNRNVGSGATACHQTVQCFVCSRTYFDQMLSRCPRCNSDSLQCYTTADLDYLVRDRIRESSEVAAVIRRH
jgi:hypothetical protein